MAAAAVTGVLILVTRLTAGSLSENTVARLLRLVSPIVSPLLRIVSRNGRDQVAGAPPEHEEEEASEREIQAYLEAGTWWIDNYRIGAKQQIETYGQIMDVPVSFVESADDMKKFLALYEDADLIVVNEIEAEQLGACIKHGQQG